MTPADRLRRLRKDRGWTQADAARELGCSQASISEWERGVYPIPRTVLRLMELIQESG